MDENNYQPIKIDEVLKKAFSYWNRTLIFQLSYSLLYFSIFFLGYFYLFRYFGFWNELQQYRDLLQTDFPAFNKKVEEITKMPQAQGFVLGIFVLMGLLNPLNVGFYNIYKKIDIGEKIVLNDLFAGYIGLSFFKFFGFYLFWFIVLSYANGLLLLGPVWILVTLFSIPLMFFMNIGTFQGIKLTIAALLKNFPVIFISLLVGTLFSLAGILLFGFGFLLTFPFLHAIIYVLFQTIFKVKQTAKPA